MKKAKTPWWHGAKPIKVTGYTEETAKGEMGEAARLLEQGARMLYETHRKLQALPDYRLAKAASEDRNTLAWSLGGACSILYYSLFEESLPGLERDLRDTKADVLARNRERLESRARVDDEADLGSVPALCP